MPENRSVEISKSVPIISEVDVLVVGCGIAGSVAAVTAARTGARTMVVDRYGRPGGNMGPGWIGGAPNLSLPEPYAKTGLPGVPGEFVRRCEKFCGAKLLNHYFRDSQVISYVWLKMMEESGVELMFNTFASDPIMENGRITGLVIENKSGTQAIMGKVVIDATGDADVAARAGAPVNIGDSAFNPGIYFAIANVDIDRFEKEVIWQEPPEADIQWALDLHPLIERRLQHLKVFVPYYRKAWEAGDFRFMKHVEHERWTLLCDHGIFRSPVGWQFEADPLRREKLGILGALVGIHGPWDKDIVPSSGDAGLMNRLETESRKFIFETAEFARKYLPAFEESYLHFTAPYFHARGGRSIECEYNLNPKDVEEDHLKDDVVFVAMPYTPAYHVKPDWRVVKASDSWAYKPKKIFDYPYRQLLPQKVEGLLGAGRSVIIPPPVIRDRWMVMLSGQAAGAAAALSVRNSVNPRDLDVRELQRLLVDEFNVPLGDEKRLQTLGLD